MSDNLLTELADEIRETNIACGWYDDIDQRTFGDDIALLHSEASEALDAYREHGFKDMTGTYGFCSASDHLAASVGEIDHLCKPEGVGSELADVLIRLIDTADRRGIDLLAETRRKIAFNRTRAYRHGGKRL